MKKRVSTTQNTEQHDEGFSNIKVYCRLRQAKKTSNPLIKYDNTMLDDGENCFSFDYIFGRSASQ